MAIIAFAPGRLSTTTWVPRISPIFGAKDWRDSGYPSRRRQSSGSKCDYCHGTRGQVCTRWLYVNAGWRESVGLEPLDLFKNPLRHFERFCGPYHGCEDSSRGRRASIAAGAVLEGVYCPRQITARKDQFWISRHWRYWASDHRTPQD